MLAMQTHGAPVPGVPPLVIAHGLFGSGRNWGVIAKRLSDQRQVITVDMRNHGQSPWFDSHTYPELAADLAEVAQTVGAPVDILGHSMGGKAAMVLALSRPELLRKLIVADIAPVAYGHSQMPAIEAMQSVDLSRVKTRADAAAQMQGIDPELVPFLLQSLDLKDRAWRLNLDVLARDMPAIVGFPAVDGKFTGPTLFLTGADSDYVQPEHRPIIRQMFTNTRFARLNGAGHWLHAEKPREFEQAVRLFLNA